MAVLRDLHPRRLQLPADDARPGDRVHCFVRIFAPTRFRHKVSLHWQRKNRRSGKWFTRDRIPLDVVGGRDQGYRGYAFKARYNPGRWRIQVKTEDGRVVGEKSFRVRLDDGTETRRWKKRLM